MLPVDASPEIIIITLISAIGLVMSMAVMGIAYLRVRNAKDALDESERRYRAVVEDQTELICRFKPDGTLVFVNDAFSRFFNIPREMLENTLFVPTMDAEEHEKIHSHLRSLTTIHPIATMINRVYLSSGESRWLRWNNRGIFDVKGSIQEYQAVGTDVTDIRIAEEKLQKYHENLEDLIHTRTQELMSANAMLQQEVAEQTHAEHQLATEKERLAVTLRSIGDGVITADTRGKVLLLNKVAEELTGFRYEQAFLRPLSEVFRVVDEQTRIPLEPPEPGRIRNTGQPVRTTRGILLTEGKPERLVEQSAAGITDHENKNHRDRDSLPGYDRTSETGITRVACRGHCP